MKIMTREETAAAIMAKEREILQQRLNVLHQETEKRMTTKEKGND